MISRMMFVACLVLVVNCRDSFEPRDKDPVDVVEVNQPKMPPPDFDRDGRADPQDPDDDNDGVPDEADCGAKEPKQGRGHVEVCDDLDNDCDGLVDEENAEGCIEVFLPTEGQPDGGLELPPRCLCVSTVSDPPPVQPTCDADAGLPMVAEVCDGIDNDCDGQIDEDLETDTIIDNDEDGSADCFDPDDDNDGVPDTEDGD